MYSSYSTNWFCIHPQTHVREVQNNLNPNPTTCGTCECLIAGKMFNCSACNSDLHPFCKSCPEHLSSPLHPVPGHPLTRLNRDVTHALTRSCAVCSEVIKGVSYTCSPCNFDVHPQCSQMPRVIPHGPEAHHVLELQVREILDQNCHVCGGQCGRWVYKCGVCSVYVHFLCLLKLAGDEAYGGPTTTNTIGLNRNLDRSYHGQGQHYGGSPQYYNYNYNIGGLQHHGYNQWGGNNYHHHHRHQNYNNHYAGGGRHGAGGGRPGVGGLVGGLMVRIAGSLAVSLLCDVVDSLFQQGLFFC